MSRDLTVQRLFERFDIDLESGRVVWKTHRLTALIGKEAGCPWIAQSGKTYWNIKLDGKRYRRGQLIFFAANGTLPKPYLDHIDGNSLNDAASNLRAVTPQQNTWNRKGRVKRDGLPNGVRQLRRGRFEVRFQWNGKTKARGVFDTAEEAGAFYQQLRRDHYGQYA